VFTQQEMIRYSARMSSHSSYAAVPTPAPSPAESETSHTITELLDLAKQGDRSAWESAFGQIYGELKVIARKMLGFGSHNTLSPTGLVHECYLRLAHTQPALANSRSHFHALAARAMRYILINRARDRQAGKRDPGLPIQSLGQIDAESLQAVDTEALELLALDQAMQRLEAIDPSYVRILECRIFAGLTEQESADALDMPLRSVQRSFAEAKQKIATLLAE
jgi:RNA polymerase sigma factor (TIGR02999 family)